MQEYMTFWNGNRKSSNIISHATDYPPTIQLIMNASGVKSIYHLKDEISKNGDVEIVIPGYIKDSNIFQILKKYDIIIEVEDCKLMAKKVIE